MTNQIGFVSAEATLDEPPFYSEQYMERVSPEQVAAGRRHFKQRLRGAPAPWVDPSTPGSLF